MEGIRPHVVKGLPEVLVRPRRFPEPEHAIFDADPVVVLQGVEPKATHVAEAVEVDRLELIPEDPHNFLREACKPEGDAHDFGGNLTGDIILLRR